jgi:hypothetical protein
MRILLWGLLAVLLGLPLAGAGEQVNIGAFSSGGLAGWREKAFKGRTQYTLVQDEGVQVLQAESHASASGLHCEQRIDLSKTPYLNWRWKVANTLGDVNERTKPGDDYPARVYVIFSTGPFFWQTRTVVYVWSSNQPVGAQWVNAFTTNARVIAVESGEEKIGQWLVEKRDVRADYRALFGEDIRHADAVAIMTDTDNSGRQAIAWYGDIWFSER